MIFKPQNTTDRLKIPSIGVDAPVVEKKGLKNGKLPEPDTPDDIVYHNLGNHQVYGGKVGKIGNAIFTGHVDSGFQYCNYGTVPPPCKAVLWDLDRLKRKEIITLHYKKREYRYTIVSNKQIPVDQWLSAIKKSPIEMITIITCTGSFNRKTHSYDSYQVVRAERIRES